MTYKASLDKTATIITIAVTIFFAIIIGGQYVIIKDAGRANPFYTTAACLIFYFLAFAFRPIRYIITENELIVERPLINARIRREDIRTVERIEKNKIKWSLRMFGVGGVFRYYGTFTNLSLGRMTWYATRKDNPVLIKTANGSKIIVTPNEPDNFLKELNQDYGFTS